MGANSRAAELVALAGEQGGLVTSRQARVVAGISGQQLKRMADTGMLERLHHGLYRVARFPYDEHQDKRAAWIALDPARVGWERLDDDVPTGVLSHRTAAEVHRIGDLDADTVEITATRRVRLSLPDVKIHRGALTREDWQVINGMPVTTPLRTVGDLAAVSTDADHLAAVIRDALGRSLITVAETVQVLAPHAFGYGHRPFDGEGFLVALIESAGVPVGALELTAITSRNSTETLTERASGVDDQ